MKRHISILLHILLLLALSACGVATPIPSPTPMPSRFEPVACRFQIPMGETIECGDLVVPEDRRRPDGPNIRLHVAIIRSHSQSPTPDPVVYLAGGPGDSPLSNVGGLIQSDPGNILDRRDLIVFDQRGAGYSGPSMRCPERGDLLLEMIDQNLDLEEVEKLTLEADLACRDRLLRTGVNLAAYTSAENSADVNDLRIALGYDEWNLWGVSYGTRLALTVMRDYPQGVRSVVLDSVDPQGVELFSEFATNAQHSFDLLFESCAADSRCNLAFPDLKNAFYELVNQLNAQPATVRLNHPATSKPYNVSINGNDMVDLLFVLLRSTDAIPWLPKFIYEARAGRFSMLSYVFHNEGRMLAFFDFVPLGLFYSVECGETAPFSSAEMVAEAGTTLPPPIRNLLYQEFPGLFAVCEVWGVGEADPIENQPVVSDIPTLILAGQFDPVTPPAWGRLADQTLSHASFFEIPAVSHMVLGSGSPLTRECTSGIFSAFLNAPGVAPRADCLVDLPAVYFVTE